MLKDLVDGILSNTKAAIRNSASYHPRRSELANLWDAGMSTDAGVSVDQRSVLGLPAIMRGMRIISSTVANVPWYVYKYDQEQGRLDTPMEKRNRKWARKHPAWEAVTYNANSEFPQDVFFETMTAWAVSWGNAVGYIDRSGWPYTMGDIVPLLPDRTWPVRIDKDMVKRYDVDETLIGKIYYRSVIDGKERFFSADDCIHIRGLGPSPYWGYDIVDTLRDAIGGAVAAQRYGNKFYGQGAMLSGFVTMPTGMSPEAEKRFAESLHSTTGGIGNAHRLVVLEHGSSFQPWASDPEKAQFLEGKKFNVRELAQIIGIKPHKLIDGADNSYNSLTEANREHISDDIMPWVNRWKHEFNDKLRTNNQKERETHVIDYDDEYLDWVPFTDRAEGCVSLYNNGIIDKEEARERCNFGPSNSPDGRRYRMPSNHVFEDQASISLPTSAAVPPSIPVDDGRDDDDSDDSDDDPSTTDASESGASESSIDHEAEIGRLQETIQFLTQQSDQSRQQREAIQQHVLATEARKLCRIAKAKSHDGSKKFDTWVCDGFSAPSHPAVSECAMADLVASFSATMNHLAETVTKDELCEKVIEATEAFQLNYPFPVES